MAKKPAPPTPLLLKMVAQDGAQPIRNLQGGAQPMTAQSKPGPGKPPNQGTGGKK
jgi:hypothetical protein